MNKIETNYIRQIIKLHEQVQTNLNKTLNDAIRIGELLTLKKQELGHGNFGNWIKSSLPFTDRTARNYIKVYSNQNELKMESVSDLKGAYKLLKASKDSSHGWMKVKNLIDDCLEDAKKTINDPNSILDEINTIQKNLEWLTRELHKIELKAARHVGKRLKSIGSIEGVLFKDLDDSHFPLPLPDFENMTKEIIRFLENDCKSRGDAKNYFKKLERNLKSLQDEYGIYRVDMEQLKGNI
jgi:hypothetical protein